jgi:hypothetical protein
MTAFAALTRTDLPFEPGEPRQFGGLTIVPLFPSSDPLAEYVGLDEGVARGFVVTEVDETGSVNALRVENALRERVLLYEGEALVGAKQDRVVALTVLVEAESSAVVSVDCVERGRWRYRTRELAPAPHAAYPQLRRIRARGGGQGDVWASVAGREHHLCAYSVTEAVDALYDHVAESLAEYAQPLRRVIGQSGAIAAIGRAVRQFRRRQRRRRHACRRPRRGFAASVTIPVTVGLPSRLTPPVSLTRARHAVHIFYSGWFGWRPGAPVNADGPSRFLRELGLA